MGRTKLNRKPLEDKLWNYLRADKKMKRLEVFTDMEYNSDTMFDIWETAHNLIVNLPNYKLIDICKNIDADLSGERKFGTYRDVFFAPAT